MICGAGHSGVGWVVYCWWGDLRLLASAWGLLDFVGSVACAYGLCFFVIWCVFYGWLR